MADAGELIVKNYLESKGFNVEKIQESDFKTPDFKVHKNSDFVFYCEEKSLDDKDCDYITPDDLDCFIANNEDSDATYNSLSTIIRKAIKQFNSVNPNREFPNVLAITNFNIMKDIQDIFISLTGYAPLESGEYLKIHKVGRLASELHNIDLFLWFNKDNFSGLIWGDNRQLHVKRLKEIF